MADIYQKDRRVTTGTCYHRNVHCVLVILTGSALSVTSKKILKLKAKREIYKIKDDAIPTIFTSKKDTKPRSSSMSRIQPRSSSMSRVQPRSSSISRIQRAEERKFINEVCFFPCVPSATNTIPVLDHGSDGAPCFSGYSSDSFVVADGTYDENTILTREMSTMTDLSFSPNAFMD